MVMPLAETKQEQQQQQTPQQYGMPKSSERKHPMSKPKFVLNRLPLPKNSRNEEMEVGNKCHCLINIGLMHPLMSRIDYCRNVVSL